MTNFLIAVVVVAMVGAAIAYIVKEKKRGVRCIGCPAAGQCSRKHCESESCTCDTDE